MSVELNYPLTTASNYTYDSDKIEISGGVAKLKEYTPAGEWTEDFADDTDFTYDSDKAEFSGGVLQQKDQRPTDANMCGTFTVDENLDWADINTTVSLSGGATYDGVNDRIDLTGRTGKKATMSGNNFENLDGNGARGCIRFKITWGSTSPNMQILELTGGGNSNAIILTISGSTFYADFYDSSGTLRRMIGYGLATSGTHVIEINFDFDGTSRIFEDGIQKGSTNHSPYTRENSVGTWYWGGQGSSQDFYLEEIICFNNVQHTSNHSEELPYTYPIDIYAEVPITLPTMTYAGIEDLQSFDTFTITEVGTPKYILNDKYWDGGAWASSDGTYAQASSASDINTNIGTLSTSNSMVVKVVFPGGDTQNSVDDLTIDYTGQIYYTDNPTIEFNSSFRHENIDEFTETATKPTDTEIKYILKKGSTWYYWNGSAWVESDETYSQANTATEIETNKASFTSVGVVTYIKAFFNTTDVDATPELDNVKILYDFSGATTDEISKCIVWGYNKDAEGNADTTSFTVYLNTDVVQYKNDLMLRKSTITVTPDSNGYWEVELTETINMVGRDDETVKYIFDFTNGNRFEKSVPDEESKNYYDLT